MKVYCIIVLHSLVVAGVAFASHRPPALQLLESSESIESRESSPLASSRSAFSPYKKKKKSEQSLTLLEQAEMAAGRLEYATKSSSLRSEQTVVNVDQVTAMVSALKKGKIKQLKKMVNGGLDFSWRLQLKEHPYPLTAASLVILYGHSQLLPFIFKHNGSVTMERESYSIPLPVHYAAARGDAYALYQLRRHGADMNARLSLHDDLGVLIDRGTPAHVAIWYEQSDALAYLFYEGCNLNLASENSLTPLQLAKSLHDKKAEKALSSILLQK